MPSPFSTLLHPTRTTPPPVDIDLGRVVLAGTGVWALALLVTVVLALTGEVVWDIVWVCATGVVLGFVGLLWARRHRTVPEAKGPTTQD
ncbi:DUF2530 domain-containing protein [Cellulomonas sp.]|uniref:DUF2530 domain-containing protein n=1 Tax=Cellulomonas sp. TaxID=40001 RepID=UPI003BAA57F5